MKIDLSNLRASVHEVTEPIASLLERMKRAQTTEELVNEMSSMKEWPTLHGKSELVRWATVLNRLDEILEAGTKVVDHRMAVDVDPLLRSHVIATLRFSLLVFENTTSRSTYNSVDRLLALMESSDCRVILEVLLVFQMMGKRSRFLSSRLAPEIQKRLCEKLMAIAECWGGRLRDVKMADCVWDDLTLSHPIFPFHFTNTAGQTTEVARPDSSTPLLSIVEDVSNKIDLDEVDRAGFIARLRLLRDFEDRELRVNWLIVRLLAMSTLLHSRCMSQEQQYALSHPMPEFIKQTCAVLFVKDNSNPEMDTLKAEALRTLTAICSLDMKPHRYDSNNSVVRRRVTSIMEHLEATSYHGFLASYVRQSVDDLKNGRIGKPGYPSISLCTALFSLLYHMASLDHPRAPRTQGGAAPESLISSGITQTMISVISSHDLPLEYTSFVTRCVRVVDVVSAIDVTGFISNKGMDVCVNRLVHEVDQSQKENPFMIDVSADEADKPVPGYIRTPRQTVFCHHQRGALIKSLLNFIKRIINERDFVDQVRHLMEGGLPDALRHIFSNIEYYSSALFHYSMQLVQNFIYQEPAQLTMLQNKHLPFTLLMAVLRKDIDPSRDVISTMAQVFAALCLNERGMNQFKQFSPFDEMLRIVLTAKYINTMKRRRTDLNDCSYNVGTTLDDLLRQHHSLRELCLDSFVTSLRRLIDLGSSTPSSNYKIVMSLQKASRGSAMSDAPRFLRDFHMGGVERGDSVGVMSPRDEEGEEGSEEEEEEIIDPTATDETVNMDQMPSSSTTSTEDMTMSESEKKERDIVEMTTVDQSTGQRVLPLGDYLCILTRIIEQVLFSSSPSNTEMIDGLIQRGGIELMLSSLRLPQLQVDLAASSYPAAVSTIIRHAVQGGSRGIGGHVAPQSAHRDEVIQELIKWGIQSLTPVAQLSVRTSDQPGVSLISHLDKEKELSHLISSVMYVSTMLSGITKCASIGTTGRDGDLRNKVIQMWTDNGSELHSLLHKVYSVFAWEHSIFVALKHAKSRKHTDTSTSLESMVDDVNAIDTITTTSEDSTVDIEMDSPSAGPSTSSDAVKNIESHTEAQKLDRETKLQAAETMGMTREEFDYYYGARETYKHLVRAYKSIQDLLSCFSRVCIGTTTRSRRGGAYDASTPYALTKTATKLADIMFREYYSDFKFAPIGLEAKSCVQALYFVELLNNVIPTIMDEKRQQYHHLIARFYSSGCYAALFDILPNFIVPAMMEKRISSSYEQLFTEWCKLVARLSTRSSLMQSRYKMVDSQARLFPLNKYYLLLQQDIFDALTTMVPALDNKTSSKLQCTEIIFTLLTEVTQNLASLKHDEAENDANGGDNTAPPPIPTSMSMAVNSLMDMGFDRASVMRALADTTSVTEAMELLLADQPVPGAGEDNVRQLIDGAENAILGGLGDAAHMELMEMLGDGPNVVAQRQPVAEDTESTAGTPTNTPAEPSSSGGGYTCGIPSVTPPVVEPMVKREVKLDWESIVTKVTTTWIPLMIKIASTPRKRKGTMMNENATMTHNIVFHLADLTVAIKSGASDEWLKGKLMAGYMRSEILDRIALLKLNPKDDNIVDLGVYLHYTCLVFDAFCRDYYEMICSPGKSMVMPLIDLINFITENMTNELLVQTVLSPALLWLELFDKNARYTRRLDLRGLLEDDLQFMTYGYEDRYSNARGKWTNLGPDSNKKLTASLYAGVRTVSLKQGRRDTTIDLIDMIQKVDGSSERSNLFVTLSEKDSEKFNSEMVFEMEQRSVFNEIEMAKMVNALVGLLSHGRVAAYGAHSALQLLVRLTRDERVAAHFVQQGGLAAMIKVRGSPVRNTEALFAQLIRHCVEEDAVLTALFDKMIRGMCSSGVPCLQYTSRWPATSTSKEIEHVLAYVGLVCTRSPIHYYNALKQFVKIDKNGLVVSTQKQKEMKDGTSTGTATTSTATVSESTRVPSTPTSTSQSSTHNDGPSVTTHSEEKKERPSSKHAPQIIDLLLSEVLSGDWATEPLEEGKSAPLFRLFSRSTIMYTIAELVRSYSSIASLVTDMKTDSNGQTVMARLLDKYADPTIEKDTTTALHCLLATIASCQHSQKAQDSIMNDIKQCLIGFSSNPEAHTNIHLKINELALVISSMMSSCPSSITREQSAPGAARPPAPTPAQYNNIVKLTVKKRILNELIRCITRLVLSKRESVETCNAVIRTIDDLARACYATPTNGAPSTITTSTGGGATATFVRGGRTGGNDMMNMSDLFAIQQLANIGDGARTATLRAVDVGRNGVGMEVHIDMNGLDGVPMRDVMNHVHAVIDASHNEDMEGVLRLNRVGRPEAEGEEEEEEEDREPANDLDRLIGGAMEAEEAGELRSRSSSEGGEEGMEEGIHYDDIIDRDEEMNDIEGHPHMDDGDHDEDGDDVDDEEDDDGEDEEVRRRFEAATQRIADALDEDVEMHSGEDDEDEEGEEDDDGEDEEEEEDDDDEEAIRVEEERERAENALASASAGGEEGERNGDDEENESMEEDDDDHAFDDFNFVDRDVVGLQRIFMDMDHGLRDMETRWMEQRNIFSEILGSNVNMDHFPRGTHASIYDSMNMPNESVSLRTSTIHPLMQRPSTTFTYSSGDVSPSFLPPSILRPRGAITYRGATGTAIGGDPRQRIHLVRQNAVRRQREIGQRADTIELHRLMERMTRGIGGGGGFGGTPTITDMMIDEFGATLGDGGAGVGGVGANERNYRMNSQMIAESCPSTLERLRESGRILDDVHTWMLAVLLNSFVYYAAKKQEQEEEAARKAASQAKMDKAAAEATPVSGTPLTDEQRERATTQFWESLGPDARPQGLDEPLGQAPNVTPADTTPQPTAESVEAPAESTSQAPDPSGASVESPVQMDTNEGDTVTARETEETAPELVPEGVVSISSTDAAVSPAEPSSGSSTAATIGDENSTETPMDQQPLENSNRVDEGTGGDTNDGVTPGMQRVPQEYRDLLGVDEIPDGVDAAFLAALPDDMRADVLRDHERQQRLNRPAPAAASTDGSGVRPTVAEASAPGIEPLDQEFLNALPPELQEEILQQHERAIRAATAAAAPPAAAPAAVVEDNPAEVIRSLPPSLRAQVLADADDSVLQVLPQELADEARRLRNERTNAMSRMFAEREYRHPRMLVRTSSRTLRATIAGQQAPLGVGHLAGTTATASAKGVQMLDRDSFSALIMMFFVDSRLSQNRLQKTLRDLCQHKGTCDYLIYALLAILKQVSSGKNEEIEDAEHSWTDTITVGGVGHNERVITMGKNGDVHIHPLHIPMIARNVIELLVNIARLFPGHFVPHVLRKDPTKPENAIVPPPLEQFWQTVIGYTTSNPGTTSKDTMPEHVIDTLEQSPLAHVMSLLQSDTVIAQSAVHEKLVKLLYTIVQTLPDDTLSRLKNDSVKGDEETPLCGQLKLVCALLTSGTCSPEALHDGRLLLVEAMRAMNFRTTASIYDMLTKRIEMLGMELQPQIAALLADLAEVPEGSGVASTSKAVNYDSDLSREQRRRTEMERESLFYALSSVRNDQRNTGIVSSCPELQVPSVRALQEKGGVQSALLSSLQTITKVRDTLRSLMADRTKKRMDEALKKYEAAKKIYDDKKKAKEEAATKATNDGEAKNEETTSAVGGLVDGTTPEKEKEKKSEKRSAKKEKKDKKKKEDGDKCVDGPSTSSTITPVVEEIEPKLEDFLTVAEEKNKEKELIPDLKLSQQLAKLEDLWSIISDCMSRLGRSSDPHAVLVLQPAAEAFFLVHAVTPEKAREATLSREGASVPTPSSSSSTPAPSGSGSTPASAVVTHSTSTEVPPVVDDDTTKLLHFAEKHRSVLNQILRQNQSSLTEGPFAVLAACPKLLDFDVKRSHFRKQLGKVDDRQRYRRDDVPLRVRRSHIFSDSFRELFRLRGNEWKNRFYIMFEGEEGQDAGGLLREWFSIITREIFNPNYALFITAPGDRSTYMINKASYINPEHIDYFKFVGRIIAKAIHDNKLLDCYFTRAFYKHILNLPVRYQDLESEDPEFYKSLEFLLNNPVETLGLDLTFTLEVEEFGVLSTRPLKEDGDKIAVTDENKAEYVQLVCQMKMTSSIRRQLDAFLDGFYEVIPKQLIAMFNEQELELLISGLPDVDIDDLAANTEYRSYNKNSREIQWFWRALRSFEPEDRAKFLQFVTGTSKVPLNGFSALEGMNGVQKFSIHQDSRGGNRLPAAHTCFNQLDLPVYDSYEKLHEALLLAIRECTEGFGFA